MNIPSLMGKQSRCFERGTCFYSHSDYNIFLLLLVQSCSLLNRIKHPSKNTKIHVLLQEILVFAGFPSLSRFFSHRQSSSSRACHSAPCVPCVLLARRATKFLSQMACAWVKINGDLNIKNLDLSIKTSDFTPNLVGFENKKIGLNNHFGKKSSIGLMSIHIFFTWDLPDFLFKTGSLFDHHLWIILPRVAACLLFRSVTVFALLRR